MGIPRDKDTKGLTRPVKLVMCVSRVARLRPERGQRRTVINEKDSVVGAQPETAMAQALLKAIEE